MSNKSSCVERNDQDATSDVRVAVPPELREDLFWMAGANDECGWSHVSAELRRGETFTLPAPEATAFMLGIREDWLQESLDNGDYPRAHAWVRVVEQVCEELDRCRPALVK